MSYLLDTNVVSETFRVRPDARVLAWIGTIPSNAMHISVMTLGEIRKGVEMSPEGPRKEALRNWLDQDVPVWFGPAILPVTQDVAARWGRLLAEVGRSVPIVDSLIAATALYHRLKLVTRDKKGFRFPGLQVIDPWQS